MLTVFIPDIVARKREPKAEVQVALMGFAVQDIDNMGTVFLFQSRNDLNFAKDHLHNPLNAG